ncbi:hypothetical protein RhiJN_02711 [Ceratobasidium sp. AG-Ba]|nr:hypothetical protein RhiJN_02711 [Ceratobasidium sp. AG-Ba]QRW03614.1 hypothetical protein RhiLY_02613 [Ceratobasidium sp. AG-Ba]
MVTSNLNCDVYFTHTDQSGVNTGMLAKIVVHDPIGDRIFTADHQTPSTNHVHGVVLYHFQNPSNFAGEKSYVTRACAWRTVILIGDDCENAMVVLVDNYNGYNLALDKGNGTWSEAGAVSK